LELGRNEPGRDVDDPHRGDGERVTARAGTVALTMGDEGTDDAEERPGGEKARDKFKNRQKETSLG